MIDGTQPFLTPPEVAKMLRVSAEKVLGWIRQGELKAVNVSLRTRPRYRISRKSLDDFLRLREVQPPPPRSRERRRKRPEGGPVDPVLGEKLLKSGEARKIDGKYYRVWDGVILFF